MVCEREGIRQFNVPPKYVTKMGIERTVCRTSGEYALRLSIAHVTLGRTFRRIPKARCHKDIGLFLLVWFGPVAEMV